MLTSAAPSRAKGRIAALPLGHSRPLSATLGSSRPISANLGQSRLISASLDLERGAALQHCRVEPHHLADVCVRVPCCRECAPYCCLDAPPPLRPSPISAMPRPHLGYTPAASRVFLAPPAPPPRSSPHAARAWAVHKPPPGFSVGTWRWRALAGTDGGRWRALAGGALGLDHSVWEAVGRVDHLRGSRWRRRWRRRGGWR